MLFTEVLQDCFLQLEKIVPTPLQHQFISKPYSILTQYHFSIGMLIRNTFLYEDNRLYSILSNSGIDNPDDMSDLIMHLFYLHLHTINGINTVSDKTEK